MYGNGPTGQDYANTAAHEGAKQSKQNKTELDELTHRVIALEMKIAEMERKLINLSVYTMPIGGS